MIRPLRALPPWLLLAWLLLPWLGVAGQAVAQDYAKLNGTLVDGRVIPGYERLAEATAALAAVAGRACEGDEAEALREAYHHATDAWQGVQHFRFGPAEAFMRSRRIAFWPDPRDRVGQQLREILAAGDESAIAPEAFRSGSVAVQGLPAMEVLLFEEPASAPAGFRCRMAAAIGENLAALSAGILTDWQEGEAAFRDRLAAAGQEGSPYADPQQATLDLFKSLHLAVELVADHKLARPLGDSAVRARPRLAEGWRSGRELRNIVLNLEAAEALYRGGEGGAGGFDEALRVAGQEATADLFERAFAQTLASARSLDIPFDAALSDPAGRRVLEQLARETAALKALLAQRLAPALGLPLGFNALDGD